MIASPRRISPSSTVSESHCPWYGHNAFGTSLISSGPSSDDCVCKGT